MPKELTPRQLLFIQHRAGGKSIAESYLAAGYQSAAPSNHGCKLMRNPAVKARLAELQAENTAAASMTRTELIEFLTAAIRTPADQVTEGHPLCQEIIPVHRRSDDATYNRIKVPVKLHAAKILMTLTGWGQPEKATSPGHNEWQQFLAALPKWTPSTTPTEPQPTPETPPPPSQSPQPQDPSHTKTENTPQNTPPTESHPPAPETAPNTEAPKSGKDPRYTLPNTRTPTAIERRTLPNFGPDADDDDDQSPGCQFIKTPHLAPWNRPFPNRHYPGVFDHTQVKAIGGPGTIRLSDGRRV